MSNIRRVFDDRELINFRFLLLITRGRLVRYICFSNQYCHFSRNWEITVFGHIVDMYIFDLIANIVMQSMMQIYNHKKCVVFAGLVREENFFERFRDMQNKLCWTEVQIIYFGNQNLYPNRSAGKKLTFSINLKPAKRANWSFGWGNPPRTETRQSKRSVRLPMKLNSRLAHRRRWINNDE